MKKLYFTILLSFLYAAVIAQLQNNSFESWTTTSFDEPANWQSGNKDASNTGLTPVTRVNGTSGYAVRMETMVTNNGDTVEAYIANGDPMEGKGGIPISGQPTALTGSYRYNLVNNDSAIFLLLFKQNGVIISQSAFKIHGTGSQNTFTQFSFPVSLNATPDSVIIAAASSNLIDNVGVEAGSFLELDNISFAGINSPIDNSQFENWTTHSTDIINGWETYGEGVTKTTDSHDGTYAISLRTIDYGGGNIGSAGMTNGHNTQNGPVGGAPFNSMSDTLTGWFKYSSQCNDTAFIGVSTMSNGMNVGGGVKFITPVSQYTYFELPFSSNMMPDTMHLDFNSSKWPYTNSCDGSTLIIDQIALKSELIAGIAKVEKSKSVFAYPNPANNFIHINGGKKIDGQLLVEIYDLSGRLVLKTEKNENSDDAINISTLKSGRYYYRLASAHGESMSNFTKQ